MENTENIDYPTRSRERSCSGLFAGSPDTYFSNSPKVLLVEDNFIARKSQQLVLELLGCKVIVAESAEEGLSLLDSQLQAVILDKDLPGISGISMAQIIRQNAPGLPLIMCASSGKEIEAECLDAGINKVLTKPMRIEQIYKSLAEYLV